MNSNTNLSVEWLNSMRACSRGITWFRKQKKTDSITIINKLIRERKFHWASWLIVRLLDKEKFPDVITYAIKCVIKYCEKKYAKNKEASRIVKLIDEIRGSVSNRLMVDILRKEMYTLEAMYPRFARGFWLTMLNGLDDIVESSDDVAWSRFRASVEWYRFRGDLLLHECIINTPASVVKKILRYSVSLLDV